MKTQPTPGDSGNSLVVFTKAAQMLAEADTIQKAKEFKSLALTAAEWAKQKGMGDKAIQHCRAYAARAEIKLGKLLAKAEKQHGARGSGKNQHRKEVGSTVTTPPPTLAELGISKQESSEAQMLADLPPDEQEEFIDGKKTKTDLKRKRKEKKREAKRAANRDLVEQAPSVVSAVGSERYQSLVLDPPWDWGDEGDADQLGRARPTYATMSIDEVAELPVSALAAKNAHVYLWITNRSLPKGFALLERWGFRYITMLTWVKPSFGMGNYFRGSTEQVLFGVRGSLPLLRNDVGTHFAAARPRDHSAKPDEFYSLVESCSPGPWLEMFSRKPRRGWAAWGAEV